LRKINVIGSQIVFRCGHYGGCDSARRHVIPSHLLDEWLILMDEPVVTLFICKHYILASFSHWCWMGDGSVPPPFTSARLSPSGEKSLNNAHKSPW
jgi:hypothetical protein